MSSTLVCEVRDLICAMCRDVYSSPRFMKGCYHSFCLQCIQDTAKATGSKVITCPTCQRKTTLPRGSAANLQANMYLKDHMLDEARKLFSKKCGQHLGRNVDRVCLTCKCTACEECGGHGEGHKVHVLSELEEKMEARVDWLEERVTSTRQELCNLQAKASSVSRTLRHQRELLNRMVEGHCSNHKKALKANAISDIERLSVEIPVLKTEVKNSKAVLALGKDFWEKTAWQSDMVSVAKQVKRRLDEGEKVLASMTTTQQVQFPSLSCRTQDVDDTLRRFLGQPLELPPPEEPAPPPVSVAAAVIPVKIRRPLELHEILGVAPSPDGKRVLINFRGNLCVAHSSMIEVKVKDGAVLISDYDTNGKTVGLYEWHKSSAQQSSFCALVQLSRKFGVLQISKAHPRMCLSRDQLGMTRLHYLKRDLLTKEEAVRNTRWKIYNKKAVVGLSVMSIDVVNPFNMDVTSDEMYCVVIDKGDASEKASFTPYKKIKLSDGVVKTEHVTPEETGSPEEEEEAAIEQPTPGAVVKLFRKDNDQLIDIYCPTKSTFVPSDVCFCCWKKRQLLIADWQNDEIHVVRVGKSGFSFKHLLAERHGEVVKPSALNTDTKGGVWVGCSNGTLLHLPMEDKTH